MAVWCMGYPQFKSGDRIVSLAFHPPEIKSGTEATIISPQVGMLYAVQLPDGELHRWFAWFELQAVNPSSYNCPYLQMGDYARVVTDQGHPPMIKKGMVVKIVKVIGQTPFYDLRLEKGKYHRWLAEFEITHPV